MTRAIDFLTVLLQPREALIRAQDSTLDMMLTSG